MVVFNSKYGHQINCTNVYDINLDAYIVGLLQNQSINLLSTPTSFLSERMENSTFCRSYGCKNELDSFENLIFRDG